MDYHETGSGAAAQMMPESKPKRGDPFSQMNDRELKRTYGQWHREKHITTIPEEKRHQFSHSNFNYARLIELLRNPELLKTAYANSEGDEAAMAYLFMKHAEPGLLEESEEKAA